VTRSGLAYPKSDVSSSTRFPQGLTRSGGRSGWAQHLILPHEKGQPLTWPTHHRLRDELAHEVPSDQRPGHRRREGWVYGLSGWLRTTIFRGQLWRQDRRGPGPTWPRTEPHQLGDDVCLSYRAENDRARGGTERDLVCASRSRCISLEIVAHQPGWRDGGACGSKHPMYRGLQADLGEPRFSSTLTAKRWPSPAPSQTC
jgi:hypothetical protein